MCRCSSGPLLAEASSLPGLSSRHPAMVPNCRVGQHHPRRGDPERLPRKVTLVDPNHGGNSERLLAVRHLPALRLRLVTRRLGWTVPSTTFPTECRMRQADKDGAVRRGPGDRGQRPRRPAVSAGTAERLPITWYRDGERPKGDEKTTRYGVVPDHPPVRHRRPTSRTAPPPAPVPGAAVARGWRQVGRHSSEGNSMATMTVWAFDDVGGADKAIATLKNLQQQQLINVQDAAIVTWEVGKKKPKTRQLNNLAGAGALGGAFWGMLFGLLFLIPLLGAAIGAATGALAGSLADVGIDDK